MENLVNKYTSEQLRKALAERLEVERGNETKEGEIARQSMLSFLIGKKFLLERHPNPNCINLYEVDINYFPTIEKNQWITVKILTNLTISYSNKEIESEFRISDETTIRSSLTYSFYDDFKPDFNREESKYKSFSSHAELEEISESTYKELLGAWNDNQKIIKKQFDKLKE